MVSGATAETEERAVDNSSWDGPAVMSAGASSDDPAAFYRAVCAGRRDGDPSKQATWALPHHKSPGAAPNAAGVRNSLSRLPQTQGLTNSAAAQRHLDAHLAEINAGRADPPTDGLFRSMPEPIQLKSTDKGLPILNGHFAVFNQWAHIRSVFEGEFMESVAPGSFTEALANARSFKALFDHGMDGTIGRKPLGPIKDVREDERGAYYEVELIPTSYNRDVEEMARHNLLGSSFRFNILAEDFVRHPQPSDHNPEALPERTVRRAHLLDIGPTPFPVYADAEAGMRSDTDIYLQRLLVPARELLPTPVGVRHSGEESRVKRFASREEYLTWLSST